MAMVSVLLVLRLELFEVPGRVQLAKEHTVSLEPFRGWADCTLMMRSWRRIFAELRSIARDGVAASRIDLLELWYVALYYFPCDRVGKERQHKGR